MDRYLSGTKILIIEDEAALAESMADYFFAEDYRCEFAASFHEAMEKIAKF